MTDTARRLLELLSLFQSRRFWPCEALSEELGITPRTVRRDVERLRELGYAVHATSGPGGGYRFGAGTELPPILLSEDEAVTLTVALQSVVEQGGERALPVLTKLDQLLPERLRARVAAVQQQTLQLGVAGAGVDLRRLTRLALACRDGEAARLRYRPATGEPRERTVYPLRLATTGNRRWYLIAWDPERGDWRTLRLDRIEEVISTGPRVIRPDPPPDLARFLSESVASAPYPCRATLELRGSRAALALRIPPWVGALVETGPDTVRLDVGGPDWAAVLGYALMARAEFRVLAPEEAVSALAEASALLARASKASGGASAAGHQAQDRPDQEPDGYPSRTTK